MKILHTADWHIGKKLCDKSRLEEQKAVLDEITQIAEEENVDAVIVAGDVFDTSVPPAEAEELFYRSAVNLSKGRKFIAIAGNHDDPERLSAPRGMAGALNIFLIGEDGDNRVIEIESKVDIKSKTPSESKADSSKTEKLRLAVCPYPRQSALAVGEDKDKPYTELVKNHFDKACASFDDSAYNVLVTHAFATKSAKDEDGLLSDERTLGTASLLPESVFPSCDYVALGHIHKPYAVSKSKNILYSGSILSYSFDDLSEKSVCIVEFSGAGKDKKTTVKRVPLKSGKKLVRIEADSFEKAKEGLESNKCAYVHIDYCGNAPLSAGEVREIKKHEAYCSIAVTKQREERTFTQRIQRSLKEQFIDFYKFSSSTDSPPPDELIDMFLKVLNGEETAE